jgi:hypothetical protein
MDVDHCIFEIDDFISKEKCVEIIERFENDPEKRPAGIMTFSSDNREVPSVIVDEKRKSGREVLVNPENRWSDLYFFILETFAKKVSMQVPDRFCKHFEKYGEDPDVINDVYFKDNKLFPGPGLTLNCTTPNTSYAWHSDHGDAMIYFTGLLYLNDIDPEDGGATEFLFGKRVQPKAGKLLMFPSVWSVPHRGMHVRVNKYAIAFPICLVPESYIQENYFTLT